VLLEPNAELVEPERAVAEPFDAGGPRRFEIGRIAADHYVDVRTDRLASVDTDAQRVRTIAGLSVEYDALLVAVEVERVAGIELLGGARDASRGAGSGQAPNVEVSRHDIAVVERLPGGPGEPDGGARTESHRRQCAIRRRCQVVGGNSQARCSACCDEATRYLSHDAARYREADACRLLAAQLRIDCRECRDANDASGQIDKRTARVAGVDRCAGLDDRRQSDGVALGDRPAQRRDDPLCHAGAQAKRVADC
jgi:hypothetical protein